MSTNYSPAHIIHNLRNRIAAAKRQHGSGYVTTVDVPIHDAEELLKERDKLVEALEACRKAWLHEAAQGDGIMEEHSPVLAQVDVALALAKDRP